MDKSITNNKELDKVNKIFTSRKSNQLSDQNWHVPMAQWLFVQSKTMAFDRRQERTVIGTSQISLGGVGEKRCWLAEEALWELVDSMPAGSTDWLPDRMGRDVQSSRFSWRSQPDKKILPVSGDGLQYDLFCFVLIRLVQHYMGSLFPQKSYFIVNHFFLLF